MLHRADLRASNTERKHREIKRLRGWPTRSVDLRCLVREQFDRTNNARIWCGERHGSFDCRQYDLEGLGRQLKGYQLQVNATNLFDKTYVTLCQDIGCYYGLRRQVIATLRYRW
jgi:hypothetical protein